MNPCSLSTTPFYKGIWNTSNLRCKNKCLGWSNRPWLYTPIFPPPSEKPRSTSITNSTCDISLGCFKDYWWPSLPNSKPLIRLSNSGSTNPNVCTAIDSWPWKILPNTRASCSICLKNHSANSISNVISNKTNLKTLFSVTLQAVFQANVNTTSCLMKN